MKIVQILAIAIVLSTSSVLHAAATVDNQEQNFKNLQEMIIKVQNNATSQLQSVMKQLNANAASQGDQLQKNIAQVQSECQANTVAIQGQIKQLNDNIQAQIKKLQAEIQELHDSNKPKAQLLN